MKTLRPSSAIRRGFTLMELMVAMAITTIIVTVLVSITSVALDTWNRSRAELRASRQAKSMIDTMARDFESLVTRRGNKNEWLSAMFDTNKIGDRLESSNAARLVFFTAATDRYQGQIGTTTDLGGDVSCVGYQLQYKDPLKASGSSKFETFVLNRLLVDPKETFEKLLGATDAADTAKSLDKVFASTYSTELSKPQNFVCENVFQFSVTFHVQVSQTAGTTTTVVNVPVTVGKTRSKRVSENFRILGTGLEADLSGAAVTNAELASGRVTAMEMAVTVISDFGIDQLRTRTFTSTQQAEFLAKNSYQYTKLVQLPSM